MQSPFQGSCQGKQEDPLQELGTYSFFTWLQTANTDTKHSRYLSTRMAGRELGNELTGMLEPAEAKFPGETEVGGRKHSLVLASQQSTIQRAPSDSVTNQCFRAIYHIP